MDLRLSQERRLVMTLALSQSLEILQMPQIELATWLREEIEKNPLLEMEALERNPPPSSCIEVPATESLSELLTRQINQTFTSDLDRSIAQTIVHQLDERGFFTGSLEEISAAFPQKAAQILATLQTFDPPGIGARSLQECLLLQLKARGLENSASFLLVEKGFDDLLQGRYTALQKKLQLPDLSSAIATLSRLNLRPSACYCSEQTPLAYADLSVALIDGKWQIETVEDILPRFHLRADYLQVPTQNAEEKNALRMHTLSAKWLMRSLTRRRKLLCELGQLIVKKQAAYFDYKAPLAPLSAKELAEELQVHESTLSRAVSGKFISTPRGFMPIKALISADPVKELLNRLVDQEDKSNPWTDEELALKLTEAGHPTKRRTVSKYRTQLSLGSASQRKLRKNSKAIQTK